MLALSIFAVTTSSRSRALSMPVAAKLSTGSSWLGAPLDWLPSASRLPPAAMAPGPAGFAFAAAAFFVPAFGAIFLAGVCTASSSASSRAFSALRASSARRFSSLSSLLALLPFAP